MDRDRPSCLKRFGFLPESEKSSKKRRCVIRKESRRYYLKDKEGIYLTSRENEVSCLVAKGQTIREAAGEMQLSPRTVEFYLGNIRRKLGARNKSELLHILYEKGFFEKS